MTRWGVLTIREGTNFFAAISGRTKSEMTHPQVNSFNERSCHSATKVKTTNVATIACFDPPSGMYKYLHRRF